jgi:hypothetical protein
MDPVYFHLLANHIPIIGTIASLLLIAFALIRRSRDVAFAGLGALILTALITIPVYLTGDPAEHVVEELPGISEDRIHEHEDAGKFALIAMEVAGGIALITLFLSLRTPQPRKGLLAVVIIVALWAASVVGRTAYLGGKIRHTEVHGGPAATDDNHDDD